MGWWSVLQSACHTREVFSQSPLRMHWCDHIDFGQMLVSREFLATRECRASITPRPDLTSPGTPATESANRPNRATGQAAIKYKIRIVLLKGIRYCNLKIIYVRGFPKSLISYCPLSLSWVVLPKYSILLHIKERKMKKGLRSWNKNKKLQR